MTYEIGFILGSTAKSPVWPGKSEDKHKISYTINAENSQSPCACYQRILDRCSAEILIYMHTDIVIHDEFWRNKINAHMEMPDVVACGLGGATGLGNKDLYRKPYNINNMARSGYISNQDDAEVHGARTDHYHQVAVLDAFLMAVNVKWLKSRGGWPTKHLTHHCLDLWLACEAARDHKKIYMDGCSCVHHGGAMSCSKEYAEASWLQGGTTQSDHAIPHRWLFEEYRDVLPIKV